MPAIVHLVKPRERDLGSFPVRRLLPAAAARSVSADSLVLPAEHEERSVYAVDADLAIDGEPLPMHHLGVIAPGRAVTIEARGPARAMLVGGAPLDGERFLWWNFVATSRERIERAKEDWREGRFAPVPGETEFIPLPGRRPQA